MNANSLWRRYPLRSALVLVTLVLVGIAAIAVSAQNNLDQSSWRQQRETAFAQWSAAKQSGAISIDALKRNTMDLFNASRKHQPQSSADAPPVIWQVPNAPKTLWDCPACPRVTIIPAGEYTMGSPETETCRNGEGNPRNPAEAPQHRVTIEHPLGVGTYSITRGEFAEFVEETKYDVITVCTLHGDDRVQGCWGWNGQGVGPGPQYSWQNPGHAQTLNDPVTTLSWGDAQAYIDWLSHKTGHTYRLLSESEWEYAARAGTTAATYWGEKPARDFANFGPDGCNGAAKLGPGTGGADKWEFTSPVGSFPPNAFGLFDMLGNELQWVQDCVHPNYDHSPSDGSAWVDGDCSLRVLRGGVWMWAAGEARSAYRHTADPNHRGNLDGFRVARVL